jgi:hypothetical protein
VQQLHPLQSPVSTLLQQAAEDAPFSGLINKDQQQQQQQQPQQVLTPVLLVQQQPQQQQQQQQEQVLLLPDDPQWASVQRAHSSYLGYMQQLSELVVSPQQQGHQLLHQVGRPGQARAGQGRATALQHS